jgi:hypothetical protein
MVSLLSGVPLIFSMEPVVCAPAHARPPWGGLVRGGQEEHAADQPSGEADELVHPDDGVGHECGGWCDIGRLLHGGGIVSAMASMIFPALGDRESCLSGRRLGHWGQVWRRRRGAVKGWGGGRGRCGGHGCEAAKECDELGRVQEGESLPDWPRRLEGVIAVAQAGQVSTPPSGWATMTSTRSPTRRTLQLARVWPWRG